MINSTEVVIYNMISGDPELPRVRTLPGEPARFITLLALTDASCFGGEEPYREILFTELERTKKAGELPDEWLPQLQSLVDVLPT